MWRASATLAFDLSLRGPTFPLALAAASPALVRSRIRSRSNSASAPIEGRKRHILVDTPGLPLSIYVTPADVHDIRGARCLLAGLAPLVATSQENLGRWSLPRTGVSRVVPS
jgi:hypothetical protein